MNNRKNAPAGARLHYKKGDLIIKEGDYGLAVYKLVKGKVHIFNESEGRENPVTTLGPGQIIGEMAFLHRGAKPRTASARAIEDAELEVWHPDALSREFDEMPPIIKQIMGQTLNRLIRMNRLVIQLSEKKRREKEIEEQKKHALIHRHFYRKEVDLPCICRITGSLSKVPLNGLIKDISNSGAGVEFRAARAASSHFEQGKEYHMNAALPKGRELNAIARIVYMDKGQTPGKLFLGMEFIEMSNASRSALGFFLRS
ncbi:MAG: cyclic nucleotide-binding domain-containing protein [Deltaproteobacteria bacterium]|nr:cyclic nucleotide-binding domain-containing protein [Deltaproteobacteria bacterium]